MKPALNHLFSVRLAAIEREAEQRTRDFQRFLAAFDNTHSVEIVPLMRVGAFR